MNCLIAGGGIGGLTAALCLLHHGHAVTVCERADTLSDIGAGLQLSPNAMKVYAALGLADAIAAKAFRPEAIELRMGETGRHLIRAPLGDTAEARWGAPYLHIHRADLVTVLAEALKARAPAALRLGHAVATCSQTDSAITATLDNGQTLSADVLVGADGIHSNIRAQMLGPDAPRFTGNVAWRATVPVDRLGPYAPNPVAGAWMGKGKHAVTYLLRGGQLANLVAVVERNDWQSESWTQAGSRQEAMADFAGWHPTITTLIEQADTLYRWALFDRRPLATWVDGRAALLGDAAHPMLPFMAQGAAMAIEDAWVLAASLTREHRVGTALIAYQHRRYDRATKVQAASRRNAKTFHQRTRLGRLATYGPMWLAGRMAPAIGLSRQDWVYSHDVVEDTRADRH